VAILQEVQSQPVVPATAVIPQQPIQPQPQVRPQIPQPVPVAYNKKSNRWVTIAASLVVGLIVIVVLLRLFLFQWYKVKGPSMTPALNPGQSIVILRGHSQPKRGAIIIFTETGLSKFGQPNTLNLIKRVVGLPGDRVQIKNNQVTVFNAAHPQGFKPDSAYESSSEVTSGNINTVVPKDDVYVLGDNRPQSLDSRAYGPVQITSILGRVIYTF
jgi:signal peptidase I